MNRVPVGIFSLDILITLVVAIPFALTPSLFVVTESRQTHHILTDLWCAIGFLLSMLIVLPSEIWGTV